MAIFGVPEVEFSVRLTHRELRIIGLALSGRIRTDEDHNAALVLNKHLLEQQEIILKGTTKSVTDALAKVNEDTPLLVQVARECLDAIGKKHSPETRLSSMDRIVRWAMKEARPTKDDLRVLDSLQELISVRDVRGIQDLLNSIIKDA